MFIDMLFRKLLHIIFDEKHKIESHSVAARGEVLSGLGDILSDADCFIQALPDWIRANSSLTEHWSALLQTCEKSADAYCFRNYEQILDNEDIKVCFETGITHYRCSIFQYSDTAANFFEVTADSINKIVDFGLWDIYQWWTLDGKYEFYNQKHSNRDGAGLELSAMNCIINSLLKSLKILADYRKEQIKNALEKTYERTGDLFLSYAIKKLNEEKLPDNINVVFADQQENSFYDAHTSHGGLFAVVMMHNDIPFEITECDGTGASIYRTYFSR